MAKLYCQSKPTQAHIVFSGKGGFVAPKTGFCAAFFAQPARLFWEFFFSDGMSARPRRVTAIDDGGRCTVVDEAGDKHEQLKREQVCHQWQLEETDGTDGPDAAGTATCRDGRRAAEMAERLTVTEPRPEDTAILFRRTEEGREFRRRAVAGELASHGISRVPDCFRALLEHLALPISKTTGLPVHCTDYVSMIDDDGTPRQFDVATIRRKLGSIAKQKAPGLSGNGPDLYACMPDCWVE